VSEDRSITGLDEVVKALPHKERALFERILDVSVTYGRIVPPESMKPWIERQFGSLESTLDQKILRVTNLITLEGVMFNRLRSSRPMWRARELDVDAELARVNDDPLHDPLANTPEDVFGRIRGRHSVTASNIAKFDGFHGLVVFDEKNPLRFNREQVHDYVDTGLRWAQAAHREDPEAKYYLFIWNCLWRAGASLLHGHAQVLLGRGMHYPLVEYLRRAAMFYQGQFRTSYFDDLFEAHRYVGAAFEKDGVKVIADLTPVKENETVLIAPEMNDSFKDRFYEVLSCYRDRLGISSFNVAMHMPPIAETTEDWSGFPVIARIVDRGDPTMRTADIGAMELYAASVVSSDPFRLIQELREEMQP
jgi:hypothetical protein